MSLNFRSVCLILVVLVTTSRSDHRIRLRSAAAGDCELETDWRGRWYQSDVKGELEITINSFTSKGDCHQRSDNQALFRETINGEDCWKCITFFPENHNVLQYKETRCSKGGTLEKVCEIFFDGDAILVTLFRADAMPESCPVPVDSSGSTDFDYSFGSNRCHSRVSRMDRCADDTSIRFSYAACIEAPSSRVKEQTVTCLGSWYAKSNSKLGYFVAKISPSASTDNAADNYRCFVYELETGGGRIGMSADASCRSVNDFTEAPTIIHYRRSADSYPIAQCHFPSWIRHHHHDVQATKRWEALAEPTETLRVTKDNWIFSRSDRNDTGVCISKVNLGLVNQFVIYQVNGCARGYQCIKVWKRKSQVIEMIRGKLALTQERACDSRHFNERAQKFETFLVADSVEQACPKYKRLTLDACEDETSFLSFGCNKEHQLIIKQQCLDEYSATYNCHAHWKEKNTEYLVVKEQHTGRKSCFVFARHGERHLLLSALHRHHCSRVVLPGITDKHKRHPVYNATITNACSPSSAALSSHAANRRTAGSVLLWTVVLWLVVGIC